MKWNFKHRPDRQFHYEAYYSPQGDEMHELYKWMRATFGVPVRDGLWDIHGGWIHLRSESELTMFLLRWAS